MSYTYMSRRHCTVHTIYSIYVLAYTSNSKLIKTNKHKNTPTLITKYCIYLEVIILRE